MSDHTVGYVMFDNKERMMDFLAYCSKLELWMLKLLWGVENWNLIFFKMGNVKTIIYDNNLGVGKLMIVVNSMTRMGGLVLKVIEVFIIRATYSYAYS